MLGDTEGLVLTGCSVGSSRDGEFEGALDGTCVFPALNEILDCKYMHSKISYAVVIMRIHASSVKLTLFFFLFCFGLTFGLPLLDD